MFYYCPSICKAVVQSPCTSFLVCLIGVQVLKGCKPVTCLTHEEHDIMVIF